METTKPTYASFVLFNLLDRVILMVASRFGSRAKEVERFIKFAIVGTIGAVVDFSVLNVLEATVAKPTGAHEGLNVGLATGTAFTCAVISNFLFNRYWTFPDSRSRPLRVQLTQFSIVSIVGLLFRLIFVSITYGPFGRLADSILNIADSAESRNKIGSNIAQAISILIVLFWNYFANRYWTYNDVD
jgi:putative flippase GtrA